MKTRYLILALLAFAATTLLSGCVTAADGTTRFDADAAKQILNGGLTAYDHIRQAQPTPAPQ